MTTRENKNSYVCSSFRGCGVVGVISLSVSAGVFFLGCGGVGLKLSCLFVSRWSRCVRFGSLKLFLAGSETASYGA